MNKIRETKLLKRVEKLEQAIKDIWASCSCLTKDLEKEDVDSWNPCAVCGSNCVCPTYCPEPSEFPCLKCDCLDCICEPEDIDEEPEDIDQEPKEIDHDN